MLSFNINPDDIFPNLEENAEFLNRFLDLLRFSYYN
jgi:hypothetical protein